MWVPREHLRLSHAPHRVQRRGAVLYALPQINCWCPSQYYDRAAMACADSAQAIAANV